MAHTYDVIVSLASVIMEKHILYEKYLKSNIEHLKCLQHYNIRENNRYFTQLIYNIRTLSVNIKFICTSFRNRQSSEHLASFSGLFRSEYKWILYLTTYFVFILQCQKVGKLVRFKEKGQKQASFLAFHKCCQGCLLCGPHYISTSFILVCTLRCT